MSYNPTFLPSYDPKYMWRTHSNFYLWCVVVVGLGAAVLVMGEWARAAAEIERLVQAESGLTVRAVKLPRAKPAARTVKGIYLTANSASRADKISQVIELIADTELNAVVIDIKDYTGAVLYNSQVPLVDKLQTEREVIKNVPDLIERLHAQGIYVIARQVVFQDPLLAERQSDWAIKTNRGRIWRDKNNLAWVDPGESAVWNYNLAIAREAISLGFDEINFDYVRFPSDGDLRGVQYVSGARPKYEVMAEFYRAVGESLKDEPAWISLDLFGLTMEAASTNDLNIGQRIEDALDHVDYISPMMYPSHYPPGHLGLKNPAAHPGRVLDYGLKLGAPKFIGQRAQLRPWLQAFNLGAIYDGAKIRAQIDAVEAHTDAGWLLWNARNVYSKAGLRSE